MTAPILGLVAFIAGGILIWWSAARDATTIRFWRVETPVIYALVMAGVLAVSVHTSGMPRPRALGVPETITVVSMQLIPDEAIYLWALGDPPVAYALPWNEEMAAELQEMAREIEDTGAVGFEIELGYSSGGNRHAQPPREVPEK